jgi:hypothetical protein
MKSILAFGESLSWDAMLYMMYYPLQMIGLIADIIGVVMLFKYGLPEIERTGGAKKIITIAVDKSAIGREAKYDRNGKIGLALIVVGFVLQFVSSLIGWTHL